MKRVLLDNAYEAWATAIKYCNYLSEGIATLSFQKYFVSSLHNAIELFMKQIMIDKGNHDVAYIRRINTIDDAQLALKYMQACDLNSFFIALSPQDLDKFHSIEFKDLIEKHTKIMQEGLGNSSFKPELKLLQRLRNYETHFLINGSDFLKDEDFQKLHNFMIKFYRVIKASHYMPVWGEVIGEKERLVFDRAELISFSYKDALAKSSLAIEVKNVLDGSFEYFSPQCSAYDIAYSLCHSKEQFSNLMEMVWPIIEMFLRLGMIDYEEEVEEIPEDIAHLGPRYNVFYKLKINGWQ